MEAPTGKEVSQYPGITQRNVLVFERFYLTRVLNLEIATEKDPDRKLGLVVERAMISLEGRQDFLHSKRGVDRVSELDLLNALLGQQSDIETKIKNGEITPVVKDDPKAAEWLAVGELGKKIKDFYENQPDELAITPL